MKRRNFIAALTAMLSGCAAVANESVKTTGALQHPEPNEDGSYTIWVEGEEIDGTTIHLPVKIWPYEPPLNGKENQCGQPSIATNI